MFPNSYSFNPGVVLDPVTMTPMITHGGNITVNPLGVPMRPEQKVWQKMFIKNIPQECPNEIMIRLLNEFGAVKNFKRAVDNRGKLLSFCHFDLETGQEILRIKRLFNNIKILQSTLEIKISLETQNFIKQWTTMQKEQWRKKLLSHNFNEAKQYDSLDHYHMRDDKKYKQKIQETLKSINIQVKKLYIQKMKEEERKEHPKEKQRQKQKKKNQQQLQRGFYNKQQQWLKREREKQREYKKEKERQREREKAKVRRLEKQLAMSEEQIERKAQKYLTSQRKKQLEQEQKEDLDILMEENPPLPQEQIEEEIVIKKIRPVIQEQIKLGNEIIEDVLVVAPKKEDEQQNGHKQLKRHELFEGFEKIYEQKQQKPVIELNIPIVQTDLVDQEEQKKNNLKISELAGLIPQNKQDLWQYPINWDKLSKTTVLQRSIRPWLEEKSNVYMGGVEQKFIGLVEKKLLSRSHPDKIIKILKQLIDDDAEQFVLLLWKKLVLQHLKVQNGIN